MHSESQKPEKKPQAELFRSPDAKLEGIMPSQRNGRPKVLLVEDSNAVAYELMDMLKDEGYDITLARTFVEATAKFDRMKGELAMVITDMRFPTRDELSADLNGPTLVHYMKMKAPGVPIIAQSNSDEYLREAKQRGADLTVNKMKLSTLPLMMEGLLKKKEQ
jgi:CheY-like chemotaxis protein